jgi:hypothetical protein
MARARRVFAVAGLSSVGEVAFGLGIIGGTILWGYGVWWLLLAILKTAGYFREGMRFNLGWWGFIFPLGVFTATLALAHVTHLAFFSVVGGILGISLSHRLRALMRSTASMPIGALLSRARPKPLVVALEAWLRQQRAKLSALNETSNKVLPTIQTEFLVNSVYYDVAAKDSVVAAPILYRDGIANLEDIPKPD